jgi:hypothetical protein
VGILTHQWPVRVDYPSRSYGDACGPSVLRGRFPWPPPRPWLPSRLQLRLPLRAEKCPKPESFTSPVAAHMQVAGRTKVDDEDGDGDAVDSDLATRTERASHSVACSRGPGALSPCCWGR